MRRQQSHAREVANAVGQSHQQSATQHQAEIFADLDKLGTIWGHETFIIACRRYLKFANDRASLQREIVAKEAELARLKEKAWPDVRIIPDDEGGL